MSINLTSTILVATALTIASTSHAEQTMHSISLSGLTGAYLNTGQLTAVDFDFETPFTSINSVLLDVEFTSFSETVCAGFSCTTGTYFDVAIREPGVVTVAQPDFGPAYGFSGHNSMVETRADFFFATEFVTLTEVDGQQSFYFDTAPIDVLNDGRGSIAFRLSGGPATISNVHLHVLVDVVPEPSSLILGVVLLTTVSFNRTRESSK